jgi:hypothetical protein
MSANVWLQARKAFAGITNFLAQLARTTPNLPRSGTFFHYYWHETFSKDAISVEDPVGDFGS